MPTITLQFQSPRDLAGFRKVVSARTTKVNLKELPLTCTCSSQDVARAMTYYGASVVRKDTAQGDTAL